MAEITASMVKDLREKSGAGMMDCKKALTEANGDFNQAMALLRERGEALAVKRGGRAAKEGTIASYVSEDGKSGAIIELNSESDFVARNDAFQALAAKLAKHAASVAEGSDVASSQLEGQSVSDTVTAAIGVIGENIVLTRTQQFDSKDGIVASYIHPPGKMGSLIEISTGGADLGSNAEFKQFARQLAMHVVASDPQVVSRDQVSEEMVEAEKSIYRNQGLNEGKPANIVEKMIEGRMSKYYGEVCMLEQPFVTDDTIKTSEALKQTSQKFGSEIEVRRFVKFVLGGTAQAEATEE